MLNNSNNRTIQAPLSGTLSPKLSVTGSISTMNFNNYYTKDEVNKLFDEIEITSDGDMQKEVYDTNGDGKVDGADLADKALLADEATHATKADEASVAVKLKTPVNVAGVPFDGSADIELTKTNVGLGNVDNTSDLAKPISTATQEALNAIKGNAGVGVTLGTLDAGVEANRNEISTLKESVTSVSNKVTTLEDLTTAQGEKLTGVDAKADANTAEISGLKGKVTTAESKVTTLEGLTASQGEKIIAVETKANANANDITLLGERVTANESAISGVKDSVNAHDLKITEVENKAQANAKDITALKNNMSVIDPRVSALESKVDVESVSKAISEAIEGLGSGGNVNLPITTNDVVDSLGKTQDEINKSLYKGFSAEFVSNGEDIAIDDVIGNEVYGALLEGQTVKNEIHSDNLYHSDFIVKCDILSPNTFCIDASEKSWQTGTKVKICNLNLMPNTTYILKYELIENTLETTDNRTVYVRGEGASSKLYSLTLNKEIGINTVEITTPTEITSNHLNIYCYANTNSGKVTIRLISLTQSEHSGVESLPFGLSSTKAIISNNGQKYVFYANEEDKLANKPIELNGIFNSPTALSTLELLEEVDTYANVGDVVDTFEILEDGTGVYTNAIGEYIFDGNENVMLYKEMNDELVAFRVKTNLEDLPITKGWDKAVTLNSHFEDSKFYNIYTQYTKECIAVENNASHKAFCILIKKERLDDITVDSMKKYLQSEYEKGTPIKVKYWRDTPVTTHIPKELIHTIPTQQSNSFSFGEEVRPSKAMVKVSVGKLTDLSKINEVELIANTNKTSINSLKTTVTSYGTRLTAVEKKATTNTGEITTLKGNVATVEGEVETLKLQMTDADGRLVAIEEAINNVGTEVDIVENTIIEDGLLFNKSAEEINAPFLLEKYGDTFAMYFKSKIGFIPNDTDVYTLFDINGSLPINFRIQASNITMTRIIDDETHVTIPVQLTLGDELNVAIFFRRNGESSYIVNGNYGNFIARDEVFTNDITVGSSLVEFLDFKMFVYNRQLTPQEVLHNFSIVNNAPLIEKLNGYAISTDTAHVQDRVGRTQDTVNHALYKQSCKEFVSTGEDIVIDNGLDGYLFSSKIEGQTVKNIIDVAEYNDKNLYSPATYIDDYYIDCKTSRYCMVKIGNTKFEVGKTYTLIVEIKENTLKTKTWGNTQCAFTFTPNVGDVGIFKVTKTFSTIDDITRIFYFTLDSNFDPNNEKIIFRFMVVEGDGSGVNSFFTDGLKSTKATFINNGETYSFYASEENKLENKPIELSGIINPVSATTLELLEDEIETYANTGDVADTLEILEDGSGIYTQRLGEKTLTSLDTFTKSNMSSTETLSTFCFPFSVFEGIDKNSRAVVRPISSKFTYKSDAREGGRFYISYAYSDLRFTMNGNLSVDDFKKVLSDEPIEVVYLLETPIVTHIPKELMPTPIPTYKANNFSFGEEVKPSKASITIPIVNVATELDKIVTEQGLSITAIEKKVTTNTSSINSLKTTVTGYGTRLTTVEGKATTNANDIATLKGSMTAVEDKVEAIDPKVSALESKVDVESVSQAISDAVNSVDVKLNVFKSTSGQWREYVAQTQTSTFAIENYNDSEQTVDMYYESVLLIPNKHYSISSNGEVTLNFQLETGESVDYFISYISFDYNELSNKPDFDGLKSELSILEFNIAEGLDKILQALA